MNGKLITFEGIEGCGKSTQINKLSENLKKIGKDIIVLREPGGTIIGEKIREILQDPSNSNKINPITELLLFSAARSELTNSVIKPAMNSGKIVICDRYFDSTYAYQGKGRSINLSTIEELKRISVDLIEPDLTIILDVNERIGLERARNRGSGNLDRIELESISFFKSVRSGYLEIANLNKSRCSIIDGTLPLEQIEELILEKVKAKL